MAFTKITTSDLNSRGATTLPNQPKISATALKQEFDAPAKEVVAPKVNNLIDELEATSAATSLGATAPTGRTGETVQAVLNKISSDLATVEAGMAEAIADAHTHSNKELLDTYTQTEEDLASAVSNKHTHSNKSLLDTYDQTNANISDAVTKKHEHSNKALLDTYEQTESDLADAVDKKHSHSNKSVLDKFGESSGEPTYDGNPIGGGTGDMLASDYDANSTVKNAGGIVSYVASQAYELPTAAADTKGGIKVGTNLSISDGVLSATDTTYSEATTSTAGLMSSSDKTKLNGIADNANNYSLPTASTSTLGGVKVDGSTVTIDSNGVISSSGGGGGTTVVANPSGSASADLEKLQVGTTIYGIPSITGKADKVTSATNGDFAGLDSNGNLTDSGKKASDFLGSSAGIGDLSNVTITSAAQDDVLKYDGSKWVNGQGGGGTTVVANPSASATDTLNKIQIGSTVYSVEGGGGTTIVQIPSVSGSSFTYNATAQGAAITGLDTTHCTVVGGTGTTVTTSGDTTYVKATNAGSYSFSVKLNDTSSMVWSDLTTADKTYSFTIAKASQTISASPSIVSLDANTQTASVTISGASTALSATSSDAGVATASGTSSPITITAVANGSATISIQAQSDSNYEASNTVTVTASVALAAPLVAFETATDAQITAILNSFYNDEYTAEEIASLKSTYFPIGAKRNISLSAMLATGVSEAHHADTYQYVIIGHEHDDLATAINGHTKALLTLQQDRVFYINTTSASYTTNFPSVEEEGGYMNSTHTNANGWDGCARRTWCNQVYFNALPSYIQSAIKEVSKKASAGSQSSTITTSKDKAFLLSEVEITGGTSITYSGEGSQYAYFTTTSNQGKKPIKDGQTGAVWWMRSPYKGNNTQFGFIYLIGTAVSADAGNSNAICPAFCL